MAKRTSPMIVVCLLTFAMICEQTVFGSPSPEKEARFAHKVKAAVTELGVGESSRVTLKLRDKTKLTGYISEIGDSSFVVSDLKTAETRTVAYPDLAQIKGNNLSTGAKIAIWAAVIAGVIIVLYIVKGAFCDGC